MEQPKKFINLIKGDKFYVINLTYVNYYKIMEYTVDYTQHDSISFNVYAKYCGILVPYSDIEKTYTNDAQIIGYSITDKKIVFATTDNELAKAVLERMNQIIKEYKETIKNFIEKSN